MNWIAKLINQTHKDINENRKKRGLAEYPFIDALDHVYDPFSVISQVIAKDREMAYSENNKISNIECACGCGELLRQAVVDKGWKFRRGHKPKSGEYFKSTPSVNQQLNRQASSAHKQDGQVIDYSPAKIKKIYEVQLNELSKRQLELSNEIDADKLKIQAKLKERDIIKEEEQRLSNLVVALDIIIDKKPILFINSNSPQVMFNSSEFHLGKEESNNEPLFDLVQQ